MSPATHSLAGGLVACMAATQFPELATNVEAETFVVLGILMGSWPDLDLILRTYLSKTFRSENPLWDHRGYGHSIWAHLVCAFFTPLALGFFDIGSSIFWTAFVLGYLQVGLHLLLDMIDGSEGIYYFAPIYKQPIRLFSLVENVEDEEILQRNGVRAKLLRRVFAEAGLVAAPIYGLFLFLSRLQTI